MKSFLEKTLFFLGGLSLFLFISLPTLAFDHPLDLDVRSSKTKTEGAKGVSSAQKTPYRVDNFTGNLSYQYSFPLPKGREGLVPSVRLVFSSQSGLSQIARGWSIPMVCIHRQTKFGVPRYDQSDVFIFSGEGGRLELLRLEGNEYKAKVESAFHRYLFFPSEDRWEVLTKSGQKLFFGEAPSSSGNTRLSFGSGKTYKWCLKRLQSKNENHIDYEYLVDDGQIYLSKIKYTGNQSKGVDPKKEVEFHYQENQFNQHKNYRSGFSSVINKKLLVKITFGILEPNSAVVEIKKETSFEYGSLPKTNGDAVLLKIKEKAFYKDESGQIQESNNPDIEFEYYGNGELFGPAQNLPNGPREQKSKVYMRNCSNSCNGNPNCMPCGLIGENPPYWYVDLPITSKIYNGTPEGVLDVTHLHSGIFTSLPNASDRGQYLVREFVDMNGDGLLDYVVADVESYVNGTNLEYVSLYQRNSSNEPAGGWIGAISSELYRYKPTWEVYFQKPDGGFENRVPWQFAGLGRSACYSCVLRYSHEVTAVPFATLEGLQDIDGDGRPDYVTIMQSNSGGLFEPQGVTVRRWCRNNGAGFDACQNLNMPIGSASFLQEGQTIGGQNNYSYITKLFADINGDGLPDYIQANNSSWDVLMASPNPLTSVLWAPPSNPSFNFSYSNSPNGWSALSTGQLLGGERLGSSSLNKQDLKDLNGDGLPDKVIISSSQMQVFYNNGHGFETQPLVVGSFDTTSMDFAPSSSGWNTRLRSMLIDIDGDGLVDFVNQANESSEILVYFNQGLKGFSANPTAFQFSNDSSHSLDSKTKFQNLPITDPHVYWRTSTSKLLDINGDKKPDLIFVKDSGGDKEWFVQKGNYPLPYMLKSIKNNTGQTINFEYKSSTDFVKSPIQSFSHMPQSVPQYTTALEQLPYAIPVVSRVEVKEHFSNTTNYSTFHYENSHYDAKNREFRGFGKVTVTDSKNVARTYSYLQGEWSQGHLQKLTVQRVGQLHPLSELENSFDAKTFSTSQGENSAFFFANFTRVHTYEELPSASKVTIATVRYFDNDGNEEKKIEYLEDGSNNIGRCTLSAYEKISTPSSYLIIPTVVEGARAIVSSATCETNSSNDRWKVRFFYDGSQSPGGATVGNLTKVEKCIEQSCSISPTATTYEYNHPLGLGLVTKVTDANGKSTEFSYETNDYAYTSMIKNAKGHEQYYEYDYAHGLARKVIGPNASGTDIKTTGEFKEYVYDGFGAKIKEYISVLDGLVYQKRLFEERSYDRMAFQNSQGAEPTSSTVKRVLNFLPSNQTQSLFLVSVSFLDGLGRALQVKSPHYVQGNFSVKTNKYNDSGEMVAVHMNYESSGLSTSETTYEPLDWTSADPKYLKTFEYDALHRITRVNHSDGKFFTFAYLPFKKNLIDENNNEKSYSYEPILGKITSVKEVINNQPHITHYGYDKWGNLTSIGDAENNFRFYSYDWLNRKIRYNSYYNNGFSRDIFFEYDLVGNLTRASESYRDIRFEYDDLNRLVLKQFPSYQGTQPLVDIEREYDSNILIGGIGKLASVKDVSGETIFESYDSLGRNTKKSFYFCETPGVSPCNNTTHYQVEKTYNAVGISSIIYEDTTLHYGYYSANAALKDVAWDVGSGSNILTEFTYTPDGLLFTKKGYGKTQQEITNVTYDYDQRRRLAQITGTRPGKSNFLDLTYEYDFSNHIIRYTDNLVNLQFRYLYDEVYRLVGISGSEGAASSFPIERTYSYSPTGNMLDKNFINSGSWTYSYSTTSDTSPQAVRELQNSAGTFYKTYSYDPFGRMSQVIDHINGKNAWYTYDDEDNLRHILVAEPSGVQTETTLRYNYAGQRVYKKTEYANAGGLLLEHLYFEGYEHLRHSDTRRIHVMANGQHIATLENRAKRLYFYHQGTEKSTQTVTDHRGDVVDERRYYPYGDEYTSQLGGNIVQPTSGLNYRFNGKEKDDYSGLYYYGARYYDAELSRWLKQDPAGFSPNKMMMLDPQHLNFYAFSRNNPISYVDPDGNFAWVLGIPWAIGLGKIIIDATLITAVGGLTAWNISKLASRNPGRAVPRARKPENIQPQFGWEVDEKGRLRPAFFGFGRGLSRGSVLKLLGSGNSNISSGLDSAKSFLLKAISLQGLKKVPNRFKQTWSENGFSYQVRVHEATNGRTGSEFRVARRKDGFSVGTQGHGWEYLDINGRWHHTSTLKPSGGASGASINEAAKNTHIQVPESIK